MPTIYDLWGKTNERAKAPYRPTDIGWYSHPAVCHMLDVGYVAEVWLEKDPYLLGRFAHLAQTDDGDRPALASALASIAALHDLGKVHQQFQAKSANGWDKGYGRDGAPRGRQLQEVRSRFRHGVPRTQPKGDARGRAVGSVRACRPRGGRAPRHAVPEGRPQREAHSAETA